MTTKQPAKVPIAAPAASVSKTAPRFELSSLHGKRVTVMGLGLFGGGVGAIRWLAARGARVTGTDKEGPDKLSAAIEELGPLLVREHMMGPVSEPGPGEVALNLYGHILRDFTDTDLVVANPAVKAPWSNEYLDAARAAGVPITTEMGLLIRRLRELGLANRTIGITGSAGKSTTSAMIAHALASLGTSVLLGGNIGGSLLAQLEKPLPAPPIVVLELSSFMLHWLGEAGEGLGWSPATAVVTNISANHTDWHGSMAHYERSKQQLLAFQSSTDTKILSGDLQAWAKIGQGRAIFPPPFAASLQIPGSHNLRNAAQAVAAVASALPGVERRAITQAVATFTGLPHRLAFAGERAGVRCYNDSKSTTPEATFMALDALHEAHPQGHVHLIVGGYDKGADLTPLAVRAAQSPALTLYTIGATGPTIARAAREHNAGVVEAQTLANAVALAFSRAAPGDLLLLSPACASWDQFSNYEARGDLFCQLVKGL